MNKELSLKFHNSYAKLPESFYSRETPEQVANPHLLKINPELAEELGFSAENYSEDYLAEVFSGNKLLTGSEPLAQAYAGHQFGGLSPQLGDGRAVLLGEVVTPAGINIDLQLKGSGRTAFSRRGDGKATLYSVLREYLISEAMHALNIPTTRSLAVVASGESIMREGSVPAGVLTRTATSHIRVGTFQYFAIRGELEYVKTLADYTINKHFPEIKNEDNPYLALVTAVMDKQIALITEWMRVGFIHGVMNTDNMAISGETIDFGPCAFMDNFDPQAKYSSIDTGGRYAFANQASIGLWNLARFAETLIHLIDDDEETAISLLTEELEKYSEKFAIMYSQCMLKKIGLSSMQDGRVANDFLDILHKNEIDFTLAFRALTKMFGTDFSDDDLKALCKNSEVYENWKTHWISLLEQDESPKQERLQAMQEANPIYIPRNWYVEEALKTAALEKDFTIFEEMLTVLKKPYTKNETLHKYATTPHPSTEDYQTFCGT